jgi:hypothetical protein
MDMSEEEVRKRHIQMAQRALIDVFAIEYTYAYISPSFCQPRLLIHSSGENIMPLLDLCLEGGIRACVVVSLPVDSPAAAQLPPLLTSLLSGQALHPAYFRIDDHPVVFLSSTVVQQVLLSTARYRILFCSSALHTLSSLKYRNGSRYWRLFLLRTFPVRYSSPRSRVR